MAAAAAADAAEDGAALEEVKAEEVEVKAEAQDATVTAEDPGESDWESDDDVPLATLAEREESPEPTLAAIAQAAEAKEKAAEKAAKLRIKAESVREVTPPVTIHMPDAVIIPAPSPSAAIAAAPSVMRKVASAASVVLSRANTLLRMAATPVLQQHPLSSDAKLADVGVSVGAGAGADAEAMATATATATATTITAAPTPTIVGGLPLPLNPATPRRRRTPRSGGDRSASNSPRVSSFLAKGGKVETRVGTGASRVSRAVKAVA